MNDLVETKNGDLVAPPSVQPTVKNWIARCAVTFPDYGTMDEAMIKGKIREFADTFADINASPDEIEDAFRRWRQTGKSFPVPADIVEIIRESRPSTGSDYFAIPKLPNPPDPAKCATADDWAGLIASLKQFGKA